MLTQYVLAVLLAAPVTDEVLPVRITPSGTGAVVVTGDIQAAGSTVTHNRVTRTVTVKGNPAIAARRKGTQFQEYQAATIIIDLRTRNITLVGGGP